MTWLQDGSTWAKPTIPPFPGASVGFAFAQPTLQLIAVSRSVRQASGRPNIAANSARSSQGVGHANRAGSAPDPAQ
jgi:hypothetical protein